MYQQADPFTSRFYVCNINPFRTFTLNSHSLTLSLTHSLNAKLLTLGSLNSHSLTLSLTHSLNAKLLTLGCSWPNLSSDWTCMYLRVHFKLKQQKGRVKVLNVPICAIPPLAKPSMQVLYERVLRRPYPQDQRHVYIGMSLQNRTSAPHASCLSFVSLF